MEIFQLMENMYISLFPRLYIRRQNVKLNKKIHTALIILLYKNIIDIMSLYVECKGLLVVYVPIR